MVGIVVTDVKNALSPGGRGRKRDRALPQTRTGKNAAPATGTAFTSSGAATPPF